MTEPVTPRRGGDDLVVARVAALYEEARGTWPGAHVERAAFERHVIDSLRRRAWSAKGADSDAGGGEGVAVLERLHAGDLYLACACAQGDPQALNAFEASFMSQVGRYLRGQARDHEFADEVRQALRHRLFLPGAHGEPPKILSYAGRGPLGGWLRILTLRVAADLHRASRHDEPLPNHASSSAPGPELALLKRHYRSDFNAVVQDTLADLPARDRELLKFAFLEGRTTDEIATVYGVHRTTVARWIEQARRAAIKRVARALEQRWQLHGRELESVVALVQSQLEVSVRQFFT